MLDVIVLVAMAVTAVAFGAGLTLQAGLPLLPVLIGCSALFLVMATTFLRSGRGGGGGGGSRIDDLEQALEVIDIDLQRLDRLEDGMAGLHTLHGKVEQLDQRLANGAAGGASAEGMAAGLQDVYDRIEAVRAEVMTESRAQRQKIVNDLGALEGLIAQLAGRAASAPVAMSAADRDARSERKAAMAEPELRDEPELFVEPEPEFIAEPEPEPEPELVAEPELIVEEEESELVLEPEEHADIQPDGTPEEEMTLDLEHVEDADTGADDRNKDPEMGREEALLAAALAAAQPKPEPEPAPEEVEEVYDELVDDDLVDEDLVDENLADENSADGDAADDVADDLAYDFADDDDDDAMLEIIREGIEQGRVDLYLQPTVTLPDRKVRYFEGLTRIRKSDGEIVMPGDYMPVAKRSALMPLIDNVLVVRAVQVLRRLGPDGPIAGVFANISMHSLLDPDYFPELIEFMEENAGLSDSLVFEISQAEMQGLNETEIGCLDTLGALGFGFCLDNVVDLDSGFDGLSDRNFRFAKVSAAAFLDGPERNAADLKRRLDGAGIRLIIEKVEKEGDVARLLDHGIELAQGHLFAEAEPMNTALSRELSNASAS